MSNLKILRHGAAGTALAAALALGLTAMPASPASAKWHPAKAHPAAAHVAPAGPTGLVELSTGRGQLITLPRPMSDLFVADPTVADVQVRSPTRLYVFGKGAGETTVSATAKDGSVVYSSTVRVGMNIGNIAQMLKVAMPDAQVTATPMNGIVILTGTVAAPDDVEEANRLVTAFVGKDVQVVSRLKTSTPLQVMLKVRFAEVNRSFSKIGRLQHPDPGHHRAASASAYRRATRAPSPTRPMPMVRPPRCRHWPPPPQAPRASASRAICSASTC